MKKIISALLVYASLCSLCFGQSQIPATNNGVPPAGNAVGLIVAKADSASTQTSAVTTTTLYAPVNSGCFYLYGWIKITQVGTGTGSGSLGGSTGIAINFTGIDGTAQTSVMMTQGSSGAVTLTSALNTTNIKLFGQEFICAQAATNITYAIDYTSTWGTVPMGYEYHFRLVSL